MSDSELLGEVYSSGERSRHRGSEHLGVRYYKGEEIPWQVHDCSESDSCKFCRWMKRQFIARVKSGRIPGKAKDE
jgi:hypothetical protein